MKMTKCKDCQYFKANNRDMVTGETCGECGFVNMMIAESFFCGFGQTKEGEESNKTKLENEEAKA